jgi:hypothetical protein
MKIIKFSKSYDNILKIKEDFYIENEKNLKNSLKISKYYSSQKKRKLCKNCNYKISKILIKNFNIGYSLCSRCGHLNGIYEDSDGFVN